MSILKVRMKAAWKITHALCPAEAEEAQGRALQGSDCYALCCWAFGLERQPVVLMVLWDFVIESVDQSNLLES